MESNFRALTILSAEAVKANDTSAIGVISKGITAHKTKVVSWSNHNRKIWRKKGRSCTGGACPSAGQEKDEGVGSGIPVGSAMVSYAHTLEASEMSQAIVLVDQLKKILSNTV